LAGFLSACSQGLEPHGIFLNAKEVKDLLKMTKFKVEQQFGKPQHVSIKNPLKVYYMGYQTERFYITPSVITDRSLVEILYSPDGHIISAKSIPLNPQQIQMCDEQEKNPDLSIDWKSMLNVVGVA
jgi:hypothetical protein